MFKYSRGGEKEPQSFSEANQIQVRKPFFVTLKPK